MKRGNTPWCAAQAASLDWTEDGVPCSENYGDVYYSRDDGLQESIHTFLEGNKLPQRWLEYPGQSFRIAETGFGTGLNFLLTWQSWLQLQQPRPRLHYLSIERHPLHSADMRRALSNWPQLAALAETLLANYPGLVPGQHRLVLEDGQLILDLWWEDAAEALADLAGQQRPQIDCWYLDGFAPARNPSMWNASIYDSIAACSRPGASFSTFTAAGHVRRGLAAAGFSVHKVTGYGRKRERLQGTLASTPRAAGSINTGDAITPWDLGPGAPLPPADALVLGAGLAGCSAAAALARRGLAVTLLEMDQVASGGSGNEQGILYTRLSRKHSSLVDFALQSFQFSTNFYRQAFAQGQLAAGEDGQLCGSFHQSGKQKDMDYLRLALAPVPALAQVLDAEQANQLLGVNQYRAGFWYPGSGWLRPASICAWLASHPGISLLEGCGALRLEYRHDTWQAINAAGEVLAASPCAIIATAQHSMSQPQLSWLPLQTIRGQTTQLPVSQETAQLRAALCHEGYVAPARAGEHCIGATFSLRDPERQRRMKDQQENIENLAEAIPAWRECLQTPTEEELPGRVGFRCASPDYLPLVGRVPDRQPFLDTFADLRRNARAVIPHRGNYLPGLYLNTAHGSRGLTSTPLAAELLASMICDEPPPVSRELQRALAPARFLIRDLIRNRVAP